MKKEEKLKLVEKLVNEKIITFTEGLALIETEKEYITMPYYYPNVASYPTYQYPNPITCSSGTQTITPLTGSSSGTYYANSIFNKPFSETKDLMSYSN